MKYKIRNKYTTNPDYALEEILTDRGVKDLYNFMHPSKECELNPYDLENIEAGAQMLLKHLRANNNILYNVDCDTDGISSSSILWLYCKHLFPQANFEFRVHEHKQHGLSDMIDWVEEKNRWSLVICADSASYDIEYHSRLNDIGVDCLIIDHHEQLLDNDGNPIVSNFPNTIVINNQLSPKYKNKSLCGAGVVYKFCEVLDDMLGIKQAQEYLDLVALGEIADVMDKTDTETNYLMVEGLRNIKNKGFQTLLEAQSFSLKEKSQYPYPNLTTIDIAFYIAPLLNAITRVGSLQDKQASFYCFVEPDRELPSTKRGAKPGDVEKAAEQTARVGNNAKAKQNRIKEKAIDLLDFRIKKNQLDDNNIIIVEVEDSDGIPQEMTGLIAMAIVSKYHKPVMVGRRNSRNEIQGSLRSDSNFAGLPSFKKFLEKSGLTSYVAGHDSAAGWKLLANRMNALLNYANTNLKEEDFENCYLVDYVLDARENYYDLLYTLAAHPEYFGNHIDEIKIIMKSVSLENIMVMGANKDSIKISYNGIDYVRFKDTDFIDKVCNNRMAELNILIRLNLNSFMGKTSVQGFIDDYELIIDPHKYDF